MALMLKRQLPKTGYFYSWETEDWFKCPIISTMHTDVHHDGRDNFRIIRVPDDELDNDNFDEDCCEDYDPEYGPR